MRRWLFFVFPVLLLVSACHRQPTVETLSNTIPIFAKVYEIKDRQSDSALKLMQEAASLIDETALRSKSKFLFAEYQILKAEVEYKNYLLDSNDHQGLEAYRFYDSIHAIKAYRNNKFLTFQYARAIYYKAIIEERQSEKHVQSFSDYLQSLWITDGLNRKRWVVSFSGGNHEYEHFTGLIYDHLAKFLYGYDTWDVAMECLERSSECFEKEACWDGIASNYDLMGDIYLAREDRMGAVRYYKEADSIYRLLNTDNDFLKFNGMLHRSITLSSMGDKEGAKALQLEALGNTDSPWRSRRLHFGLGYIYYDMQEYDSSLYHYEQSYPLLPRQTAKAYCRIIELASFLGDTAKVAHYGKLLADFHMDQVKQNGEKIRMVTLYEDYKSKTKDVHNKDVFFFIILIIIFLIFILVGDTVFIRSRTKRHQQEIARHESITASLENEIESTRRVSRHREEQIKDLETKLNKVINNPEFQSLPFEKKMETLMQMPICQRVLKVHEINVKASLNYPELALSEIQKNQLVSAIDAVFPKFSIKMIERYPSLKRSDVIYCCFYILGVNDREAAALMGKTYQAVWKRSSKLHEVFGVRGDLHFVLHDVIKNW